jgi:hypothetical protein
MVIAKLAVLAAATIAGLLGCESEDEPSRHDFENGVTRRAEKVGRVVDVGCRLAERGGMVCRVVFSARQPPVVHLKTGQPYGGPRRVRYQAVYRATASDDAVEVQRLTQFGPYPLPHGSRLPPRKR